jgi:CubicO group peptidase (beta-lactamase class C family)
MEELTVVRGPGLKGDVSRRKLLAGLAVGGAAAVAGPIAPARATSTRSGLHAFIEEKAKASHLPSLATAVVKGEQLTWASGIGWANFERNVRADRDTVYMLASVSKTVTCAAVMQLWEAGSLDLDADVNRYLPFEVRNPHFPHHRITTRMLLTHTSSIRDRYSVWGSPGSHPTLYFHGDSPIPLGEFERGYLVPGGHWYVENKNFYTFPPGEHYRYSNIAAALSGFVVESVGGVRFWRHCDREIFKPLGMEQTGWHLRDITTRNLAMPYHWTLGSPTFTPYYQYGYPDYPDGELRTSASALSRWLRCFMNFGSLDGVRILKRRTVEEIRKPQIPGIWWQGLIWYYQHQDGRLTMGHNGGDFGVATQMFFDPKNDVGVILLMNRYVNGYRAWKDVLDVQRRLFQM